jgi:assimilatory nitrate reductase catalytic subunit
MQGIAITGQANGQGGREHGQKCDQLPGARDLSNPEHRAHVAAVWGVPPESLPAPGVDAYEIFRKIDKGEIKGLLSICFNPVMSLPDNNFVRRMLEKLDFYVAIDFFLSDTAFYPALCRKKTRAS